jgi:hypothetical protein
LAFHLLGIFFTKDEAEANALLLGGSLSDRPLGGEKLFRLVCFHTHAVVLYF